MAFYYSRRKLKPEEESLDQSGELNIVPYLDILMNLIMFMLLSITGLAVYGMVNVTAPEYAAQDTAKAGGSDTPQPRVISVLVTHAGFFVASDNTVLTPGGTVAAQGTPTIPKRAGGDYDFDALTAKMIEVKKVVPKETKVLLAADPDTPYEVVVGTMDAIRETKGNRGAPNLFPDVTLAAM
jgi:biopolymer transport protein ExbD